MQHITKKQLLEMMAVGDDNANIVILSHDGQEQHHEFDVRCIAPASEIQILVNSTEAQDAKNQLEDYETALGAHILKVENALARLERMIDATTSTSMEKAICEIRSTFDALKEAK
jgi:hypothetical protein